MAKKVKVEAWGTYLCDPPQMWQMIACIEEDALGTYSLVMIGPGAGRWHVGGRWASIPGAREAARRWCRSYAISEPEFVE